MSEVIYEQYKKIVVRSFMRFESPQVFAENVFSETLKGNQIPRLFWASGILFRHFPYFPSEAVSQQLIEGVLNIDHIDYAEMKEYKKEINVAANQKIKVLNVTSHTVFSNLTSYIAKNTPMKSS